MLLIFLFLKCEKYNLTNRFETFYDDLRWQIPGKIQMCQLHYPLFNKRILYFCLYVLSNYKCLAPKSSSSSNFTLTHLRGAWAGAPTTPGYIHTLRLLLHQKFWSSIFDIEINLTFENTICVKID